jgi:hypothetical protein
LLSPPACRLNNGYRDEYDECRDYIEMSTETEHRDEARDEHRCEYRDE